MGKVKDEQLFSLLRDIFCHQLPPKNTDKTKRGQEIRSDVSEEDFSFQR